MSCFEKFEACSQSIWDGCITLEVSVAESDLTSNEIPDNVFLLVNRFSFLPVALFDALEHFRQYTVEFSSDSWFECGGNPLPWLVSLLITFSHRPTFTNDHLIILSA